MSHHYIAGQPEKGTLTMSFNSWLQNRQSARKPGRGHRHHPQLGSLRAATQRLNLEDLEDRRMMAFLAPVDYVTSPNPQSVAIVASGDFNNDDRLDLVNVGDNTIGVLLGNGDGTFQPAQTSAGVPTAQSVAVGDFNSDGKLDLATGNYDYYNGTRANDVSILFGKGDGTFDPPVPVNIGVTGVISYRIATGDLNADGELDLVVTENPRLDSFGSSSVRVLLGHGDGTFTPSWYDSQGNDISTDYYAPALADFDGDGNIDVAMPTGVGLNGVVKVYLGNGDGTMQSPKNAIAYSTTTLFYAAVQSVTVGDFNGDGRPDLATENYNNTDSVLLGNGDGTFQAALSFAAADQSGPATTGDINGDGRFDLVTAGVSVRLSNGDGSFAPPITTATGGFPPAVVADFNGDGRPDAAAGNGTTVSVLLNDGNWLAPPPPPPGVSVSDVTVTEGNSGTRAATFTVTLSAAAAGPVTMAYATANGTATANGDYQAKAGTLTFAPGQTSKTITVLVNGDMTAEADETFLVNLSNATGATIVDSQGVGTIVDDDKLTAISIGDVTKYEGKSGTTKFVFTVSLSKASNAAVTVNYATANGTAKTNDNDYTAKSGMLTFAPGQTSKTVTILVKGDKKNEADESFFVNLSRARGAEIDDGQGLGTILNDDSSAKIHNQLAFASAVDAVFDGWMTSRSKRRWW
jgi:Calx-beta domain/FG-GAP-like repeat